MISFLGELSDEALNKESIFEAKSDILSSIMEVQCTCIYVQFVICQPDH